MHAQLSKARCYIAVGEREIVATAALQRAGDGRQINVRLFRRPGDSPRRPLRADDVLWGVARREGLSDTDDPIVHANDVQHAFVIGDDENAICGFAPPRRTSRPGTQSRPQLALPTASNQRCPKCLGLIESSSSDATIADGDGAADPGAGAISVLAESADDAQVAEVAGDEPTPPPGSTRARTRARRGGIVTIPAGRRSIVIDDLPPRLRGAAIAAELESEQAALRVESVTTRADGSVLVSLNQRADSAVRVSWFVVSGRHRRQ
jgi:hypothetical protein